jgi:tyrosyl-tRNA synthetase
MDKIDELLTRGVANVIPEKAELRVLLKSGRKMNVYLGIDPTATHIHLGHALPLRKLQAFVDLGHRVTFLIGDFTALVGDTSDKESERPILTSGEIEANFQTYKQQASKFLDFSKVKLRHNSEWLSKLNLKDIIQLTYKFSAGDFYSRELIKKRLEAGDKVGLHELLYPVMQGYDSYFMDTDIQIGGTDQTFNMQAGRTLQKALRNKQSFVMTNEFLTGTDGRKMSKTWGNAIWLEDPPKDVYGKVMSLRDELMEQYFVLATNVPLEEIPPTSEVKSQKPRRLNAEVNPMEVKKRLAWQITMELHGTKAADAAQTEFERVHQQGSVPSEIQELMVDNREWDAVELLIISGLTQSKAAGRRLIEQGGFRIDGEKFTNLNQSVKIKSGTILQAGKRGFVKVK